MADAKAITIEAAPRSGRGKGYARKLRSAGKIPAILNAAGTSKAIELDPKLLPRAWKENGRLFTLTLEGVSKAVKITELQVNAVKRTAVHVDLTYAE